MPPRRRRMTARVVGVTFAHEHPNGGKYPENVYRLQEIHAKRFLRAGGDKTEPDPLPVVLVRNPANEHDANAIEVHVPALGRNESMIGHLSREHAEQLAPRMDAGEVWDAAVVDVLVKPEKPNNPGVDVECWLVT